MSKIGKSLVFLLACVLTVSSCFTFVSAADNGVITVGDVEGYPGDIVEVPISITQLPSKGFASATFTVTLPG